jgi:hypothetical protein
MSVEPRFVARVFARLWLWWRFIGSADAHVWSEHAAYILVHGLDRAYEAPPGYNMYNHPPIMGCFRRFWSSLCGDLLVFTRWLKVRGLTGEFAASALLWRFGSPVAAAIYAFSPVAIPISRSPRQYRRLVRRVHPRRRNRRGSDSLVHRKRPLRGRDKRQTGSAVVCADSPAGDPRRALPRWPPA